MTLPKKGKYVDSSRAARKRRAVKLNALKDNPCVDCGGMFHPAAMDFDHITDDKVGDVSHLIQRASWQAVLDEIAKCELVCANCHRIRTYNRQVDNTPQYVV